MRGLRLLPTAVAVLAASVSAADVDPIVIKGSKFFYKTNGTEFFIRGVAYQQGVSSNGTLSGDNQYVDPLTDVAGCTRDIPLLSQLQTNTIRVYAIDPTKDHSQCMQMLQNAGIYVISDLSEPGTSINRDLPTWDINLYQRYTSVVDALANYTNVLGFFAGNEVSNTGNTTAASAFVKAAVRDTKAYIKSKNYRQIGVGYATADIDIRIELADYFNCGPSEDSIDFWGYNIYSWCDPSSFTDSKWDQRVAEFSNYSVPAFYAEYGCNKPVGTPRKFEEVGTLYGSQMTGVFSGGIVYEYFEEENRYGLVSVSGSSASKLPDFTSLSSQIAKVSPTGVQMSSYSPSNTQAQACPPSGTSFLLDTSALPPTPNEQLCSCMVKSLTCVAKPNTNTSAVEELFNQVCGYINGDACKGIARNATTGDYGSYGMCLPADQLSFAFNAYYQNQVNAKPPNTDACNFNGAASTQAAASASGACNALISQAGASGTGRVTSVPSGTGSSSGSSGSATKSAAAGMVTIPNFSFGMLHLELYITVAALVGAGMIML